MRHFKAIVLATAIAVGSAVTAPATAQDSEKGAKEKPDENHSQDQSKQAANKDKKTKYRGPDNHADDTPEPPTKGGTGKAKKATAAKAPEKAANSSQNQR